MREVRLDPLQLYLALFFSTAGFSYFIYGRKRRRVSFVVAGMGLMGFGYFVDSLWLTALVGAVLAAVPFVWRD